MAIAVGACCRGVELLSDCHTASVDVWRSIVACVHACVVCVQSHFNLILLRVEFETSASHDACYSANRPRPCNGRSAMSSSFEAWLSLRATFRARNM